MPTAPPPIDSAGLHFWNLIWLFAPVWATLVSGCIEQLTEFRNPLFYGLGSHPVRVQEMDPDFLEPEEHQHRNSVISFTSLGASNPVCVNKKGWPELIEGLEHVLNEEKELREKWLYMGANLMQKGDIRSEGFTTDDEDISVKEVANICIYQGRYRVEVDQIKAGNWALFGGIDSGITKTATVTHTRGTHQAHIFKPLQFNTISSLKVSVEPLIPAELPKMIDGLRAIKKSYPLCVTKREESGEHIILGTGELYLDCVLKDSREMFSEIEVKVSDPVVAFCETVIDTSQILCFAETPNHKNKLTMICEPLEEGIAADIENETVKIDWEPRKLSQFIKSKYKWDLLAARNIWAFGPETTGPNILQEDALNLPSKIDKKELNLIRHSVVRDFQWGTAGGPLCNEPIRNCRFKLMEAEIDAEPINRSVKRTILHFQLLQPHERAMMNSASPAKGGITNTTDVCALEADKYGEDICENFEKIYQNSKSTEEELDEEDKNQNPLSEKQLLGEHAEHGEKISSKVEALKGKLWPTSFVATFAGITTKKRNHVQTVSR